METNKKALSHQLTPQEIVKELDRYIVGQKNAKKAVAIALRNRSRRQMVGQDLQDEIAPKNIIMIGSTGVGKTEVARRLARFTDAPFVKVEASKFTEVGYVGRDVESIIRDLVRIAVNKEKDKAVRNVKDEASNLAEEKILDALFPPPSSQKGTRAIDTISSTLGPSTALGTSSDPEQKGHERSSGEKSIISDDENNSSNAGSASASGSYEKTREKLRKKLKNGDFEEKYIEIDEGSSSRMRNVFIDFTPDQGMEQFDQMMQNLMNSAGGGSKQKKMRVVDARKFLIDQLAEKLIDMDKIVATATHNVENMGIVFLDEIDKIAQPEGVASGEVSREGVQRDILPLVEGSSVNTRYGTVKTDHILFIAAGAFHVSKPSDMIPELQGRFPIRVELDSLGQDDLYKILNFPKNSLIKQYTALLETEGVKIRFLDSALKEIVKIAYEVNQKTYNIGARRLSTVMEKLLEDILFDPHKFGKEIKIEKKYVKERLSDVVEDQDLSKYIL